MRVASLALTVALVAACRPVAPPKLPAPSTDLPTFAALPDPVFTDQDGHPFNRQRMQGKVWVADFIFTTCAMACPILTARMGKIQSRLKDEDPNIQLVSFSILPETDTPPVLKAYGAPFHQDPARWAMVTGPVDPVLNPVSEGFTKAVKTAPGLLVSGDSNFTSQHGEMFILIDQTGHVRGYYRKDDAQVDQLITDAKHLAALKS